jgi:hypothetical protein
MQGDMTRASSLVREVIDITHKPKRTQAGNIAAAIQSGELVADEGDQDAPDPSRPPQSATLERAIKYFESNAIGDLAPLYRQTAAWLREKLTLPKEIKDSIREAVTPERVQILHGAIKSAVVEGKTAKEAIARVNEGGSAYEAGIRAAESEIPGV